jgi:Calcineurin-like phosphoesterase
MSASSACSPRAVSALGTARGFLILLVSAGFLSAALPAQAAAAPVIAAAGDIACAPDDPGYNGGAGTSDRCRQRATSNLLVGAGLTAVLPLGDIQYNSASLSNIMAVYDPTWGRVKSISRPILGNHESAGNSYFTYFNGSGASNGPAGPRGKGYYSFDVGSWHLVALNSNCARVPCSAGSEQERWLRADLAAHPTSCTLAYWHHPRWSSGHDGSSTFMQPLWAALSDAGAEILLSGHSHDYERFAPMNRGGILDRARGIRQFVVGTGGAFFTGGLGSRIPNSEVAQDTTFGVLKLTLHPTSYDWTFVPIAGGTFRDSGTGRCHGLVRGSPGAGSRGGSCLAPSLRIRSRRIGPVALALGKRTLLRRAGPPDVQRRRAWRYCVRGTRGRVRVGFSRAGTVSLAVTSARGHHWGRIRRGASIRRVRRSHSVRRVARGLYVVRGRRVVFRVRGGRVRFVGVAGRRLIARPLLLRRYVRLIGL